MLTSLLALALLAAAALLLERWRAYRYPEPQPELRPPLLFGRVLVLGQLRLPELASLALVLAWAAMLLSPGTALADVAAIPAAAPVAVPAASFWDGPVAHFLLDHVLTWQAVIGALTLVGAKMGLSVNRKRQLALGIYHAFHIVEDVSNEARAENKPLPWADKATGGLAQVNAYLLAQGWRPLKPGETNAALLTFKSMNAQLDAGLPPSVVPPTAQAAAATAAANAPGA